MKKTIFIFLVLFFAFSLFPQEPEWTLYTSADRVNCQLIQDSLNWVGTDIGLVRYNLETNNYIILDTNNSGLPGSYIWSLSEQSDSTIWIGTKSGVAIFDGEGWNTYTVANSNLPHNWVPAIEFALDGTIWIGTAGGLVSIIDSIWTVYTTANSGLTNNYIRGLSVDENNVIWVATWGGGLVKFDGSNWTIVTGIPTNCITEVDIDNEGRKWVGTDYCGCICITDSTQIIYNTSNSGIPSNYVIAFAFDDDAGIWMRTSGGGIAYFLNDNWIIYDNSNSSLPGNNMILSIAIENSGIVWVGGIYCFAYLEEDDWIEVLLSNSGLPCNNIYSIATYGSNDVWIGTQHGICNYDGFNWITYNINNSNLIGEKITDIAIDSNGVVWVSVHGPIFPNVLTPFGVAFFFNNTWTPLHRDNSPLPSNNTMNITVDSSNRLWSVADNYLVNIRFEDTNWICYDFQDLNLCSAISCYHSNNLVIAILNISLQFHLLLFDLETYTVINDFGYDNLVKDIKCDNNGLIWLATYSGLVKIDGAEIITFNTTNSPIPSNEINCIETETNALWIGTNDAGLIKYNGNEWINYNTNKAL